MLQVVKRWSLVVVGALAVGGCNSIDFMGFFAPARDGVERRFEQSVEMTHDLNLGAVNVPEEYIFYVCADPHIDKTHQNLDIFNDRLRNDVNASFGVILGDCSEVRNNIPAYLSALAYNPEKHLCDYEMFHVLGNHDIFFDGWSEFRELIGPSAYWFEVLFAEGRDLYITLDSANGMLGRKQTEWLKTFLKNNRSKYRHCIVLTHTNLFYTDLTQTSSGNMPIEESFALMELFGKQDVSLVLQGHDHYRENLVYDGVKYTVVGTIRDESKAPEYLKVTVTAAGVSLDWQLIL